MDVESHCSVGLAEARAHLSELIAAVEAGATVEITKRSRLVATVSPPRLPVDLVLLARLADAMPYGTSDPAALALRLRDLDRY